MYGHDSNIKLILTCIMQEEELQTSSDSLRLIKYHFCSCCCIDTVAENNPVCHHKHTEVET